MNIKNNCDESSENTIIDNQMNDLNNIEKNDIPEKENNNDISFKSNVARKSFFYKQLKNYLYDSFKVDGKPV